MAEADPPTISSPETEKTVKLLAVGVMEVYEPSLVTIKTHLKELTDRQELAHAALIVERKRLEDLQSDAVSDALIANVAMSRDRLVAISNAMTNLHKRATALQVRAANIERAARSRPPKYN